LAEDSGQAGSDRLTRIERAEAKALRTGGLLSVLAALLWVPQAALVADQIAGWVGAHPVALPLWLAALCFAGLAAVRAALEHRGGRILFSAADRVVAGLRETLTAREGRRGRFAPGGRGAAEIAALVAEKLPLLIPALTRYRPARMRATILPLVLIAVALPFSWAVAVIFLVAGPLIPVFMALVGLAAKQASAEQMEEIGTLNGMLSDRLSALIDIRALGAEARMTEDFATRAEALRERTMAVLRVAFLSSTVLELFLAIGVAMVAVFVGFSLLGELGFGAWGNGLGVGEGVFLLMLAPDFFQPLRDLSAAWHDRAAAQSVADEVAEVEADESPAILGTGGRADPLSGPAAITLQGVVLPGGVVLPDRAIAPGTRLAISGPSGAGKSTALAVLAGLIAPQRGEITVAGQRLDDATADAWRARVAWLPQVPHFLNATLWDNLGRPGFDALDPALEQAAVAEVVAALPRGARTRLGETGGGVSGGEARRLMLARAILARPSVVLADEPTADLDPETARAVTAGLLQLAEQGVTLIVATHDPDLMARMDDVLPLARSVAA